MKKYILLLLALMPVIGFGQSVPTRSEREEATLQMRKLNQAYTLINALYIEKADNKALVEGAVKEMLGELDPHSIYISPEEMVKTEEDMTGKFAGIGVNITMLQDTLLVSAVVPNGPAAKVGVLPNDRIVAVDERNVVGMELQEIVKLLRGEKRTRVAIDVKRGGDRLPFSIVRDDIPIVTVDAAYMIDRNTGYIKINRFAATTMQEMRDAFAKFNKPNALILDLRGNPGGLLKESIDMSNFFLPKGSLVLATKGRTVKDVEYTTPKHGDFTKGNVVVLIDEFSASASEIVSGALQDWDRAVIVGRRSFGKGLVQQQHKLVDGSAINITVAEYLTPSGRAIQRPYVKGEADNYYKDLAERINNDNDSIRGGDSLRFKTLRLGKDVYGGGGIYPDYYVHVDTTDTTPYLSQLLRKGVVFEYAMSYIDRNRSDLLARYPDQKTFSDNFEVSDAILAELSTFGQGRGIEPNAAQMSTSSVFLQRRLRFHLAQSLYGLSAAYEATNLDDPVFAKGLEVIRNWSRMAKGIVAE